MNRKLSKLRNEVEEKIENITTTQDFLTKQISALKKQFLVLENKKEDIRIQEKNLKIQIVDQHKNIRDHFRERLLKEKEANLKNFKKEKFI